MKLLSKTCPCCNERFSPNPRNASRQHYCTKPECREASKQASQQRWLDKNPGHFSGFANVERVRQWRLANPGYSRRKHSGGALQDIVNPIPVTKHTIDTHIPHQIPPLPPALQDFDIMQHPIFVGLIAHLTGSALQDEIAFAARRLQELGLDVISSTAGGCYDPQVPNPSRSHPHCSRTVQLGGSPSGP